jgi:signal peptidase I
VIKGIFYRGNSMRGTFVDGDYLRVSKVKHKYLKPGDLIVFEDPNNTEKKMIVHRVIFRKNNQLFTKGDSSSYIDPEPPTNDQIVGKVIGYERKGKYQKVLNGSLGILKTKIIKLKLLIKKIIFPLIIPIYQIANKTQLIPKIWKPDIQMIILGTKDNKTFKYTHKGRTVLSLDGKNIKFKRPYDMIFRISTGSEGMPEVKWIQ